MTVDLPPARLVIPELPEFNGRYGKFAFHPHAKFPVAITSLEEAVEFVEGMAKDILKAVGQDKDPQYDGWTEKFIKRYQETMPDFINQVNALDVHPSLKENLEYLLHQGVTPSLLQEAQKTFSENNMHALADAFIRVPPFYTPPKTVRDRMGKLLYRKPKKTENKEKAVEIEQPEEHENIPEPLRIKNGHVNDLLARTFAEAVMSFGGETENTQNAYVQKKIVHRMRTPAIVFCSLAFLAATGLAYLRFDSWQKEQEQLKISSFVQGLELARADSLQNTYNQLFTDLNVTVGDFINSKSWIDKNTRAQFHQSVGFAVKGNMTGFYASTDLNRMKGSIDDLARLISREQGLPAQRAAAEYLDNFSAFAEYFLPRTDSLMVLEGDIEAIHQNALERLETFQREAGFDVSGIVSAVQAARANYESLSTRHHETYTGNMASVEFFAGIFTEMLLRERPALISTTAHGELSNFTSKLYATYILPPAEGQDRTGFWGHGKDGERSAIGYVNVHKEYERGRP